MEEKYFSLSDIRHDFKRLESNGWEDIPYKEVLERMEYGAIDPAADVVPVVHARWENLNGTQEHYCSECGVSFNLYAYCKKDYKYCPNCGAKMDLED